MAGKQIRKKSQIRARFKEASGLRNGIELAFLCQDWDDGYNVGGLFRIADAAGAALVVLTGKCPLPGGHPTVAVTSMGAHRRVEWRHFDRHDDGIAFLKDQGYALIAVEVADDSVFYKAFPFPPKSCLVLGNEAKGIYGNVLRQCEAAVHIPMGGKGRSLNVHVAAGILAFEAIFTPNESSPE